MVFARNPIVRTRLTLAALDRRDLPSVTLGDDTVKPSDAIDVVNTTTAEPVHAKRFAVGTGAGQTAMVSVYDATTNALLTTLTPFGREYTGGVRVATGDLTGDGIDDVVITAGVGGGRVQVIDGRSNQVISDFFAFSETSRGGAYAAIGDVTGDGRADLVLAAGEGNRSQIRIIRGQDVTLKQATAASFFAFDTAFTGGVRIAIGDVNGDGIGDILAATGAGTAPVVKIFTTTAKWNDGTAAHYASSVTTLNVGGAKDTGGVFVSAGDVDGDGKADIAVGRVIGDRANVTVYKGNQTRTKLLNAYGFTSTAPGGVPVLVRDLDGDGRAEVLVGGGDGVSQVRVLSARAGLARSFMAFPPTVRGWRVRRIRAIGGIRNPTRRRGVTGSSMESITPR